MNSIAMRREERTWRSPSAAAETSRSSAAWAGALASWIDEEALPRLIVGPDRHIHWMSAGARRLLESGGPFHLEDGRIAVTGRAFGSMLEKLIAEARRPQGACAVAEGQAACWVLRASPIGAVEEGLIGISLRERGSRRFGLLGSIHGLTPMQGKVIEMMLQGQETHEVAAQLNISMATLRSHLKEAYRKLRVTSRAELFVSAVDFMTP